MDHFLPNPSTKSPIQGPTRMAPMGKRGPTHPASSNVIPVRSHNDSSSNVVSFEWLEHKLSSIRGSAGEVQPRALPTLKEPSVTKKEKFSSVYLNFNTA